MFEIKEGTGLHKIENPATFLAIVFLVLLVLVGFSISIGYFVTRS